MTRQDFVRNVSITGLTLNALTLNSFVSNNKIPIRAITKGNNFHWFGYYDKWQFDPTDRYVLSNQVNFEHRTPNANDTIKIGMVDIQNNEIIYTLRIQGNTFKPRVYSEGTFTVKAGKDRPDQFTKMGLVTSQMETLDVVF